MEEVEKVVEQQESAYKTIIDDYIEALDAQKHIVPISYNFLSAQLVTESKKLDKYGKKNGQILEEDGKQIVKMSIEHGIVYDKMQKNFHNIRRAYNMVGVNAVIGMVSKYDGFLGMLTKQLFKDKPEILNGSDKEFKASDILTYSDFDELKDVLVEKEIETLLRKNHIEQLQWLENKLGMKQLRDFKALPDFVEIMERRNLFVHCNGVVSRQYLSECKKYGVNLPEDVKVGTRLGADINYVKNAHIVLFQVGVMLGFVLWHKIRPNEGEEMMDGLSDVPFELIREGNYQLGMCIIDFALANKSWENEIKYAQRLVFKVNKALAYHLRDMQEECEKIVNTLDITAAEPVYHLAVAVLLKDYEWAYDIMDKIGKADRMRVNYKTWPLFAKIRQEPAFIAKYKEIYNEEFECTDAKLSDFEDILKTANEIMEMTQEMMSDKENSEEGDCQDAEIVEAEDTQQQLPDTPEEKTGE